MTIALMLILLGVGLNIAILSRSALELPRFANTCKGCGYQAPPMEYPPAVSECPICHWMMTHQNLSSLLTSRRDR